MMYRSSVFCSSVRPVRVQGYWDFRSRCPVQGNKFDPLSLYGGPYGLSFDPTNAQALLCAVNALQSTKEPRRCPGQTSCSDFPRQSSPCSSSISSNSSDSLTAPSIPAPIPCPCHASGPVQSIPVKEAVQTSNSTTSSSQGNSLQEMSQQGSSKGFVQVQVGVGTNSSKGSDKNGLTWIDWGWPGTHTPCPFNQRHTVDDVLIRPERVGFMITKDVQEANTPDCAASSSIAFEDYICIRNTLFSKKLRIFCERSNGILSTFCPFIGKLVRCCKLRVRQLRDALQSWNEEIAASAVDVKEIAASYIFVADMPGLKNTDIKVQVENDSVLRISGERKREDVEQDGEVKHMKVERSAGKFMRKFNLPANANLDNISAACQDGLLTIIVPKTPPPNINRPRTFDINVSNANLGQQR